MNLAGLPAHISLGPTSLVTTEFAPITALSPIVNPFKIVQLAPIKTLFSIFNLE